MESGRRVAGALSPVILHTEWSLGWGGQEIRIVAEMRAFRGALDVLTIERLLRLIGAQRIGVIHTHSSIDSWCGGIAGRLKGIKVVRSRHLASEVTPGLNAKIVYGLLPDRVISSGRHIRDRLLALTRGDTASHASVPAGADAIVFLRLNGVEPSPDSDGWEALMLDVAGSSIDREQTTALLRRLLPSTRPRARRKK